MSYVASKIRNARIQKEYAQLDKGKLIHGFDCKLKDNENGTNYLVVSLPGPKECIYENEIFNLAINFDDLYPCSAPNLKFLTPIYHPNIDKDGRICLNILTMPPEGSYNPTMSLESILMSVQLLISNPNPYDPLRSDAATDYRLNKDIFVKKAKDQIEMNKQVNSKATLKRKLSET